MDSFNSIDEVRLNLLQALLGGSSIIPIFGPIIDILNKILPDKEAKDAAAANLAVLIENGELQKALEQIKNNTTEAQHSSIFVAGWRPMIGWTCAIIFNFHYLALPLIQWSLYFVGSGPLPEPYDVSDVMVILSGMLGFGLYRTYEKREGIDTRRVGRGN